MYGFNTYTWQLARVRVMAERAKCSALERSLHPGFCTPRTSHVAYLRDPKCVPLNVPAAAAWHPLGCLTTPSMDLHALSWLLR